MWPARLATAPREPPYGHLPEHLSSSARLETTSNAATSAFPCRASTWRRMVLRAEVGRVSGSRIRRRVRLLPAIPNLEPPGTVLPRVGVPSGILRARWGSGDSGRRGPAGLRRPSAANSPRLLQD